MALELITATSALISLSWTGVDQANRYEDA